jgi:hypothetical protein
LSNDWFTSETNLNRVERDIRTGKRSGANADETLQMIRTIRRLRTGIRKLVAYEVAADLWTFHHDDAGRQRIEDLANNRVRPEERDESYFSWLARELAGLSNDEWQRVKGTRED